MLDVFRTDIWSIDILLNAFSFQEIAEFENFDYEIIFVFLELDNR